MKRTLQFGLLGVLAVFPYALSLVFDSWRGRVFATDIIIRRTDALMYSWIDRVLPFLGGRAEIFIYVFCWALAIGIAFRMLYTAWRFHPLSGMEKKARVYEVLARSLTALAAAIALAGIGLDAFFVFPPEGITLLQSSFGGALGPAFLYLFPMTQLAAYAFALAAMVYAAASSGSFRIFLARSGAGVAVMAAVVAALNIAAGYLDLGEYLDSVPGVTSHTEPRTLVVLSDKPSSYGLGEYYNDCSVSESFCVRIPSTRENAEAVAAYLKGKGYLTGLRGPAFSLMALDRMRRLDPAGAMKVYEDALTLTGDVTQGISTVARLVYSPATGPYRRMLDELADETRFAAGGRTALRIGKAYTRFGELDKARYWYDKGVATARGLRDEDLVYFEVPDSPPFSSGRIFGRITLDGKAAGHVGVGVMREIVCRQMLYLLNKGERRDSSAFYDLQGVMDGVLTDEDGRFGFGGLEPGEYVLLLSLRDVEGKKFRVVLGSGTLTLDEARPSADAGTIRLALEPS